MCGWPTGIAQLTPLSYSIPADSPEVPQALLSLGLLNLFLLRHWLALGP